MITIFEPNNQIEVISPKGKAAIWLVTEYGSHTEKIFTCIIKSTGEIWEFRPKDIKVLDNITFGRVDSK